MDELQNSIEEWHPIPDWKFYEASTQGRIRSLHRRCIERHPYPRIIKPRLNRRGYWTVGLVSSPHTKQKFFFVHRLVASTFLGELPNGHQVDHKNGNKIDNRPDNLEYVLPGENIRRAIKIGLRKVKRGTELYHSKLTEEMVRYIRTSSEPCSAIAAHLGMNIWTIFDARSKRTWKHIE